MTESKWEIVFGGMLVTIVLVFLAMLIFGAPGASRLPANATAVDRECYPITTVVWTGKVAVPITTLSCRTIYETPIP